MTKLFKRYQNVLVFLFIILFIVACEIVYIDGNDNKIMQGEKVKADVEAKQENVTGGDITNKELEHE